MNSDHTVHLVECPRDALQGLAHIVPTGLKIDYLNALMRVGFPTLDFGSFVSAKAVPQMADTPQVLAGLQLQGSTTRLLAIVANRRGAEEAASHAAVAALGFPFSISETFQQRNTRQGFGEAEAELEAIQAICAAAGKELVVYLSMAFGNPYGDEWSEGLALDWATRLAARGIATLSLADTVGSAEPGAIGRMFAAARAAHPALALGVHLHAAPHAWQPKVAAAWQAGCRRFDGALRGFGGCPFAADALVGNVATENLLGYFEAQGEPVPHDAEALAEALRLSTHIFLNS